VQVAQEHATAPVDPARVWAELRSSGLPGSTVGRARVGLRRRTVRGYPLDIDDLPALPCHVLLGSDGRLWVRSSLSAAFTRGREVFDARGRFVGPPSLVPAITALAV